MKITKKIGYVVATMFFLILTLGPFVWTLVLSITPDVAMFTPTTKLFPDNITWANYAEIFSGGRKGTMFFESLVNSMRAVGITL